MARLLPDDRGGIASLFALPDEVWDALEADLARVGISVDELPQRLSWRAVYQMVRHSQPTDARYAALNEMTEKAHVAEMFDDIRDSIAAAKRMYEGAG